jgi:chromosome segregation ATPase
VFQQLQQRAPRKTNAADNQALEWIGLYETQREQMQREIDNLRSQVAALNGEVRDKENSLSRRSSLSQAGSMHWSESVSEGRHSTRLLDASDDMLQRLEGARRDQEQAAAKLRQREAIMVKKISDIEQELLTARDTISELKDENANLAMEAESRPSIRDYRLAQRRIHQLERQLSEQKLALEEANDIQELRKFMGTTELMERDRMNHRLHLNRLATLPKETLLEVVKEVCRVLNLTDITLISPSLQKLCNVVTAVPRMEQFIRDVCGFVYFNGDPDNQHETETRFELEQVLPTLQQWMVDRKKLYELEVGAANLTRECAGY